MQYNDKFFEFFKTTEDCDINGKVAAWITEDRKGLTKYFDHQICHANLNPSKRPLEEGTTIYSSLILKNNLRTDLKYRAKAETYWSFIFDHEKSPWKQITSQLEIIRNPEGHMVAFKITDIHKMPVQLILNFLIATRMPREQQCLIETFYILSSHGLPEWCALACAYSFRVAGTKVLPSPGNFVHFIFDGSPMLGRVRNSAPKLQPILYGDVRTYDQIYDIRKKGGVYNIRPWQINEIWGFTALNPFFPVFEASKQKKTVEPPKHHFEKLWRTTQPKKPPLPVPTKVFVRNIVDAYNKGTFDEPR